MTVIDQQSLVATRRNNRWRQGHRFGACSGARRRRRSPVHHISNYDRDAWLRRAASRKRGACRRAGSDSDYSPHPRRTDADPPVPAAACPAAARAAFAATLDAGWLGYGPQCRELEQRFTAGRGGWALATSSCTSALYLAGRLVRAIAGESQRPRSSFRRSALSHRAWRFLQAGVRPVIADVSADDLLLEPDGVLRALTPSTRALLAGPSVRPTLRGACRRCARFADVRRSVADRRLRSSHRSARRDRAVGRPSLLQLQCRQRAARRRRRPALGPRSASRDIGARGVESRAYRRHHAADCGLAPRRLCVRVRIRSQVAQQRSLCGAGQRGYRDAA